MGVVTPKNDCFWQMGKKRHKKARYCMLFCGSQVGLEPTTLRLTADTAITMSIVIGNSHTK